MDASSAGTRARSRWRLAGLAAVILVTVVLYWPTLGHDFVSWDDDALLLKETGWRGLAPRHLWWMLTQMPLGHWAPLTWLSWAVDYKVWGLDPTGFHLSNLFWFVAMVACFGVLMLRVLDRDSTQSATIARSVGVFVALAWYAWHPLRVESVAWITERRDVLSGFWIVLSCACYVEYARGTSEWRGRWFAAALVAALFAMASKTIAFILPVWLLLLDVGVLRRMDWSGRGVSEATRRLWLEKLPFIVLGFMAAFAAAYGQRNISLPLSDWPVWARLPVAVYGIGFYTWTALAPTDLRPLYELSSGRDYSREFVLISAATLAAVLISAWQVRRRFPAVLAAVLAYLAAVAPVSGLTQAGPQLVALRYSFLSNLPWAFLLAVAVAALVDRWQRHAAAVRGWSRAVVAVGAAYVLTLVALTRSEVGVWKDSLTLWTVATARSLESGIAHANLGAELLVRGRPAEAEWHLHRSLLLRPGFNVALENLRVLAFQNNLGQNAVANLGMQLVREGEYGRAASIFEREILAQPNDAVAHNNLGVVRYAQKDYDAALAAFTRALELQPDFEEARLNLVAVRMKR